MVEVSVSENVYDVELYYPEFDDENQPANLTNQKYYSYSKTLIPKKRIPKDMDPYFKIEIELNSVKEVTVYLQEGFTVWDKIVLAWTLALASALTVAKFIEKYGKGLTEHHAITNAEGNGRNYMIRTGSDTEKEEE